MLTLYNTEILGNLNGILKINLEKIDNEFINKGQIVFSINEKTINSEKNFFKIDGGDINSKISYLYDKGDLIFDSKNILEIKNKKKFSKKFQIKLSKLNSINKIYFNLKKNIDTGKISISEIKINDLNNSKLFNKIYTVENIQELRSLLKKILKT